MRDLGSWLKDERLDKGLDIDELARMTGIGSSQISRIENQKSELTLSSMVRLAYGLDLTLLDLAAELEFPAMTSRYAQSPSQQTPAITIIDIEAFYNYYRDEAQRAKGWLYDHYHHIRSINPEIDGQVVRPEDSYEIVGEALDLGNTGVKVVPIPYPKGLTQGELDETYITGGVMTLKDLGTYSRLLRKSKGFSLRAYADHVSVAYTAIHRLENGYLDRILFKEIVEFDQKLNASSTLISIGWAAGEFHAGIIRNRALQQGLIRFPGVDTDGNHPPFQWDPLRFSLAEALVTICRWYQKLEPGDIEWLQGLRREIRFYTI